MKILGQPHDEVLLTTDRKDKLYKTIDDRIILRDGLLFRKNNGETGSVNYCLKLIPKKLLDKVLRILHGENGKQPGVTKTIFAYGQNYYYSTMAQLFTEWVKPCEQCFTESRIDRILTRPLKQNPNEHITVPEDAMQIDLVPQLPPSRGYENIVTATDVFSRYSFAYPTSKEEAKIIKF